MSQINFTPEGLEAAWPSMRWLEFLDGPSRGPVLGVELGYSGSSATLYVGTYLRSRFDAAMALAEDDPADSARQEAEARTTSLAGWQGGFAVTDHLYITAHAYGVPIEQIALCPVLDPISYGFTFESAELRSDAVTSIPGNIKSEMMHADLARLLEERGGPGPERPPR